MNSDDNSQSKRPRRSSGSAESLVHNLISSDQDNDDDLFRSQEVLSAVDRAEALYNETSQASNASVATVVTAPSLSASPIPPTSSQSQSQSQSQSSNFVRSSSPQSISAELIESMTSEQVYKLLEKKERQISALLQTKKAMQNYIQNAKADYEKEKQKREELERELDRKGKFCSKCGWTV